MQLNWIERLTGTTRGAMLALLRKSRHTITELSSVLGITDNAVRTHIAALQRDGLVEQVGVRRDMRGKPAHVFELTETAEELFPKAYAAVLRELIGELERREGPASVESLLRSVGTRVATRSGGGATTGAETLEGRVNEATLLLRALGGELMVEPVEDGYEVIGHGCPLSAVVRGHHGTCVVAEALIAASTGAPVTEHCNKGPRPACAFHVSSRAVPDTAAPIS